MTRRLRAKPSALAARSKLADGTHPGTEPGAFRGIDRSVATESLQHVAPTRPLTRELIEEATAIALASGDQRPRLLGPASTPDADAALARIVARSPRLEHDLEVRTAQRDRALDMVAALERMLTAIGGYMTPEQQAALFSARALLVEMGRRMPENLPVWVDRSL